MQTVALASEQCGSGVAKVTMLQRIIEKRTAILEQLSNVTTDLFQFVESRGKRPDLDSEMMQFFKDHGVQLQTRGPQVVLDQEDGLSMDSMSFAQRAIEGATEQNRKFQILLDDF